VGGMGWGEGERGRERHTQRKESMSNRGSIGLGTYAPTREKHLHVHFQQMCAHARKDAVRIHSHTCVPCPRADIKP